MFLQTLVTTHQTTGGDSMFLQDTSNYLLNYRTWQIVPSNTGNCLPNYRRWQHAPSKNW